MTKVVQVRCVTAVLVLFGVLASSAGAANWHTNGVVAFSSTDAGAVRMVTHSSGSPVVLQCPSSGITGTLNGPTSAALPWLSAATVGPAFGAGANCTVAGVPGYTIACSSAELRANSYVGGDTLATAGGGVTTGALANIDCRFSAGPTTCSTVTGSIPAHYINPNPIGTGSGRLTLTAAGQSLTASKIGAGCAAVPHGTGTVGSPAAGSSVGDLSFTVHGPNAPYIYRGT